MEEMEVERASTKEVQEFKLEEIVALMVEDKQMKFRMMEVEIQMVVEEVVVAAVAESGCIQKIEN